MPDYQEEKTEYQYPRETPAQLAQSQRSAARLAEATQGVGRRGGIIKGNALAPSTIAGLGISSQVLIDAFNTTCENVAITEQLLIHLRGDRPSDPHSGGGLEASPSGEIPALNLLAHRIVEMAHTQARQLTELNGLLR